jgi:uncharacterized protein (DUF3820 family)
MGRNNQQKHEMVTDIKAVLAFGKYKGESLQEIIDNDPQYLLWLHNNTDFELSAELLDLVEGSPSKQADWYKWDAYQTK